MKSRMTVLAGLFVCLALLVPFAGARAQVDPYDYVNILGDPLRISVNGYGTMQVSLNMGGDQYFDQYFGEGIATTLFFKTSATDTTSQFFCDSQTHPWPGDNWDGTVFTPGAAELVTNDAGWQLITTFTSGDSALSITLTIDYTQGAQQYTKTWAIKNNSSTTTYSSLKLLHGGDVSFAGLDLAQGAWDAAAQKVKVTNPDAHVVGYMGFSGSTDFYYEDAYDLVWDKMASPDLPKTVNASLIDAGYALQWNRDSLAPGETWTITATEVWADTGSIQLISPGTVNAAAGDTAEADFYIYNYTSVDKTAQLSTSAGTIIGDNPVLIPAGEFGIVTVDIPIESTASCGATSSVTLTATVSAVNYIASATVVAAGIVVPYSFTSDLNSDGDLTQEDYHMVSIPGVVPCDPDPLKVFAPGIDPSDYGKKVRIFQYDPVDSADTDTEPYIEYPDVKQVNTPDVAQGYYVILTEDVSGEIYGSPIPEIPQTVTAKPGWNLVGYPFISPNSLDNTRISYATDTGRVDEFIGAQSTAVIDMNAFYWNGSEYSGVVVDNVVGDLSPYMAYWFFNSSNHDVDLTFLPLAELAGAHLKTASKTSSKVLSATAPKTPAPSITAGRIGLSFALGEKNRKYQNKTLFLGLHPKAATGRDTRDCLAPMGVSANVPKIYVDHSSWSTKVAGKYATDIRRQGLYPAVFNVTMEVPKRSTATRYVLQWKGANTIPAALKVRVKDTRTGRAFNMRSAAKYEFVVPANVTKYRMDVSITR